MSHTWARAMAIYSCLLAVQLAVAAEGPRAKVGAYYFDGWSGGTNAIHLTERLQTEFAHRQPIWGWFDNTLPIMRQQIDLAADHGLAFFAFCWYWPEAAEKRTPLNNALDLYLRAENRNRLEFCLLVANHAGFRVGPKEWEVVTDRWIELFKRPEHLKVDGKPLLIFFSSRELIASFGGPAGVRQALNRLREKTVAAGLKGVSVAGCCTPGPEYGWDKLDDLAAAGFDLFTGYNYPGAGAQPGVKRQTFASMVAGHEGIWESFTRKTKVPYIPVVTTGWDMRPWERRDLPAERQSVYYPDRTPEAVGQFVGKGIDWLDRHPDKTPSERLVLLYAWNENGEGGYLTPTKADGDTYLKAVQSAIHRRVGTTETAGTGAAGISTPVPLLRSRAGQAVEGYPELRWRYVEFLLEWGFGPANKTAAFDGNMECTQTGMLGAVRPVPGDTTTAITGERSWTSPPVNGQQRGIVAAVLYTPALRGPGRTIVTVRTKGGSFSFQPVDLETGPVLAKELGFFVRRTMDPVVPDVAPAPPQAPEAVVSASVLKEKMNAGQVSAYPGWGSNQTPCVYANTAAEPAALLNGLIKLPARSVAVHPAPDRDIAVGWRSPFEGKVAVKATVTHAHPSGGNGIEWWITRHAKSGRSVLLQGTIDRGGSATVPSDGEAGRLTGVAVEPGDILSLVIGSRGDHACDSTSVELNITQADGNGRQWDLAREIVPDIHAGNPHADSEGRAGTWYFYAPPRAGEGAAWQPPIVRMESRAATASEYLAKLAARQPRSIRQRVRELPEQTWASAMRAVHGDQAFPPFPKPPLEPRMSVEVPDPNLTALWRIGAWQIIKRCPRIHRDDIRKVGSQGDVTADCRRIDDPADPNGVYVVRDNPFPPLGCETDRILWALDQMGMHHVARDGMSIWLENQQPDGALSLNSGMELAHKVGAVQLPWVMAEHYRYTGDREWLKRELPRLKSAADWIINRRRTSMKPQLSPEEVAGIRAGTWSPYGLQPRIQMGDGDPTGATYFYMADAFAYRSLKLLADVVGDVDSKLAADLAAEVEGYRKDILKVLDESLIQSPVIRTRDGLSRSFLPQGFQYHGPCARALPESVNIFSHCGPYSADIVATSAAVEAWLKSGLLLVNDPRLDGHFDVLEDLVLDDHPWIRKRKPVYSRERDWFGNAGWGYQSGWERVPEYYLAADDVPNFLRAWLNRCAVDLNLSDWTFNEHTTFATNDKSHGNSVFLSNFRNMLVMEIGEELWLARATPRAWLEQGKRITVTNSPTYFGTVSYEIVSDVEHGTIHATLQMPSRKPPGQVVLRLRHPKSNPIRSVLVNGKASTDYDPTREIVHLKGMSDRVEVRISY